MLRFVLALAVLVSAAAIETAPPQLPKHFAVHGENWLILQSKQLRNGDDGETNCQSRTVLIRPDIAQPRDVAETLMHEVMHALGCDHGEAHDERWNNTNDPEDGMEGHAGIYWGAKELVNLMVDNPELVRFIQEAGKQ
jgi:hypothetical protein